MELKAVFNRITKTQNDLDCTIVLWLSDTVWHVEICKEDICLETAHETLLVALIRAEEQLRGKLYKQSLTRYMT